jgi:predicted RNase H-like HicB family nuclease
LKEEPEGGFTVIVPSLPGCVTYGETIDEAIEMAREAMELYIEPHRTRRRYSYRGKNIRIHDIGEGTCLRYR